MFITFRCIVLIFFVSLSVIFSAFGDSNENGYDFQKFMDNTKSPCDDFYGYACGNWQRELQDVEGEFRYLENYLNLQYIKLFATGFEQRMQANETETNKVYKKAQDIYDSCRKTQNLEVFKYIDILKTKYEDLNWFHILHNSKVTLDDENWNWLRILGRLRSFGFNNALISMKVVRTNATSSIIKFDKPEDIEFDSTEQLALEPLEPEMRTKIISFKQQLISAGKEQSSTKSDFLRLTDVAKYFDINNYLEMLPNALSYEKIQFQIEDLNYIRDLQALISKTPKAVVAFFIGLKFVSYIRTEMPKSTKPMECLAPINAQIPEPLNFIYADQYYSGQRAKTDLVIDQLFRNLKKQFLQVLTQHSGNVDDATLEFLQQKILFMQLNIGQVPVDANIDFYENYFKDLVVNSEELSSFYHNHLNVMQFRFSKHLQQFNMTVHQPEYILSEYRIAPILDIYANTVIYPFSLLHKPIFDSDDDKLFHYAGIASIMAHDMSHALDLSGLKYDGEGNPNELFFKKLHENGYFDKALKCLQKHPTSRMNEKIADFIGSRIAYDVYFAQSEDKLLNTPFNMTKKQIFFVKFSQFYCVTDIQTSDGEPMKWLSQIVENNEEFFEVFQCKNQENYESCKMW